MPKCAKLRKYNEKQRFKDILSFHVSVTDADQINLEVGHFPLLP